MWITGVQLVLPIKVGPDIPVHVEGQLACLPLAAELVILLGSPQLVSKSEFQLVLPHVTLQLVQPVQQLRVGSKSGRLTGSRCVPHLLREAL